MSETTDQERIAALERAVCLLIPCAEAAEICLRADGLFTAADRCISALENSRGLVYKKSVAIAAKGK